MSVKSLDASSCLLEASARLIVPLIRLNYFLARSRERYREESDERLRIRRSLETVVLIFSHHNIGSIIKRKLPLASMQYFLWVVAKFRPRKKILARDKILFREMILLINTMKNWLYNVFYLFFAMYLYTVMFSIYFVLWL